jgi:hypothetical protein
MRNCNSFHAKIAKGQQAREELRTATATATAIHTEENGGTARKMENNNCISRKGKLRNCKEKEDK